MLPFSSMAVLLVGLMLVMIAVHMDVAMAVEDGEKEGDNVHPSVKSYGAHMKDRFERTFHEKCSKYPFVQKWVRKLENPGKKYYTFVFQDDHWKNGGLGDRIGGLLTAIATSLRTDRQLLVTSSNRFHDLFRPYHPTDIVKPMNESKYTWHHKKWKQWTEWEAGWSENDEFELDLYYCINCPAWRNKICGLDDGDTGMSHNEPYVKLRGNRAFICKWATHPELGASKQLKKKVFNVTSFDEVNLYEAAGCMMRLAMWPTDQLWAVVAEELEDQMSTQIRKEQGHGDGMMSAWGKENTVQIAAHFRCGDFSYIKKDEYNDACRHDVSLDEPIANGEQESEERQKKRSQESPYMPSGTPNMLGTCVGELVYNHTVLRQSLNVYKSDGQVEEAKQRVAAAHHDSSGSRRTALVIARNESIHAKHKHAHHKSKRHLRATTESDINDPVALLYVTSDNPSSADQIREYAEKVYGKDGKKIPTIVAPKGCHVDLDQSFDCSLLTITQWIILSSSDYIVTQTDKVGSPISAYSRYAAVYGLRGDSLRNSKDCSVVQSLYDISRRWNGNWFCD